MKPTMKSLANVEIEITNPVVQKWLTGHEIIASRWSARGGNLLVLSKRSTGFRGDAPCYQLIRAFFINCGLMIEEGQTLPAPSVSCDIHSSDINELLSFLVQQA
jgi:hypothetical protein